MTAILDRPSILKRENPERNSVLVENIRRRLWSAWAPDGRCAYGLEKELAAKGQLPLHAVAQQIKGSERMSGQLLVAWIGVTIDHTPEAGNQILQDFLEPIGFFPVPLANPVDIHGLLRGNSAILESIARLQTATSDALADGAVTGQEAAGLRGVIREAMARLQKLDAELGGRP